MTPMDASAFALAAQMYCLVTRASGKSSYRTAKHNETVGGVAHSAHLVGLALDVVYDKPLPLAERDEWASRLGLRLITEDDHDHLQPLDWRRD